MKATPIAQYLDQKGRSGPVEFPSARRDASAFTSAPMAYEEQARVASLFRRSALIAAVASRPNDSQERPRPKSVFLRSRESAPEEDLEARLAEAYRRGVQEGSDTAREEAAAARALELAESRKRAVVEQLDFQMNEYAKLAEAIATGLSEVEGRIAEVVARVLRPFVTTAISSQIVGELADKIARLRQPGRPALMRIRGPERLLSALKERIASLAVDVEYSVEEGVEVVVEAADTTISSELAPWADLIASLTERA